MEEQITFVASKNSVKFAGIVAIITITFLTGFYLGTKRNEEKIINMLKENHFSIYACRGAADEISNFTFDVCKVLKKTKFLDKENVTVSAYSASFDETDDSPNVPAAGGFNKIGQIAVSRDLFKRGWKFNKTIIIDNLGTFVVRDVMNKRFTKRVDVFLTNKWKAKRFGVKRNKVATLMK